MTEHELFTALEHLARLGTPGWHTTEHAVAALATVRGELTTAEGKGALAVASQLLTAADLDPACDVRLECGCLALALLHHTLHWLEAQVVLTTSSASSSTNPGRRTADRPPPPPGLLSVQQTKVVGEAARLALHTTILASLDQEGGRYLRTSLARSRLILGSPELPRVAEESRHPLLAGSLRLLLPVVMHEVLGIHIRGSLFPEVLSSLLALCFCPETTKAQPEDTAFFRTQLEDLIASVDPSLTLSHLLLLLMGMTQVGGGGGGGGWLGRACSSLVVLRYLLVPGGLEAVVGVALALCGDRQDWRQCQAVATVVARARTKNLDRFYATLGPQLWELLRDASDGDGDSGAQVTDRRRRSQLSSEVVRVAVLVVGELAARCPRRAALHVTLPFLHPLASTTHPQAPLECVGTNLTECVTVLHKMFVEVAPPSTILASLLQPVLSPLATLATLPTTHLRTLARQLLIRYLGQVPEDEAVNTLLALSSLAPCPDIPPLHPALTLAIDGAGGAAVRACSEPGPLDDPLEEDETRAGVLAEILGELGSPMVVLGLYRRLVTYIDFTTADEAVGSSVVPPGGQLEGARRVALCSCLLARLAESERVTEDLFEDLSAAAPIVASLLAAGCQQCQDEDLLGIQDALTLDLLTLVSCYLAQRTMQGQVSAGDWRGLRAILPTLDQVLGHTQNDGARLLAGQLRDMVATHGVVAGSAPSAHHVKWPEKGEEKTREKTKEEEEGGRRKVKEKKTEDTTASKQQREDSVKTEVERGGDKPQEGVPQITRKEEVPQWNQDQKRTVPQESKEEKELLRITEKKRFPNGTQGKEEWKRSVPPGSQREEKGGVLQENQKQSEENYKSAMEDLLSPLLPVRGHGLLALSKLVECRDPEALSHAPELLALFQHHLREEDSYLYLMAVQGLAVLGDAFPERVVAVLTREFSLGRRSTEDRAKLAESLSRAARRLGPLLPHHRDHFVNSFLAGVRDPEWLVRAASLSALGDVCKELRFSLGPIVHEVLSVLCSVVKGDDSAEVRGAALLVVTMLLQGLDTDAFKVLREVLRELYRVLRLVHTTDPAQLVRLHAQLALEEVDALTRRFLLPQLSLTKQIFVVDVPPSM